MLCDICGKNPATVHLTEIIDEQMTELHLCEECAKQKSAQMGQQFGLSDLLAGMTDFSKVSSKDKEEFITVKCPNCGLTYADFKKVGRLGCSECYTTFKKYLGPLLKRIHGANEHVGKAPLAAQGKITRPKKAADLQSLRKMMQDAINSEAFEEAAKIRDQIRALEDKERQSRKEEETK